MISTMDTRFLLIIKERGDNFLTECLPCVVFDGVIGKTYLPCCALRARRASSR